MLTHKGQHDLSI